MRDCKQKRSFLYSGVKVGRGTECPPETSDQEISGHLLGKKRKGKNGKRGKWRRKQGQFLKGRRKIENWRRKKLQMTEWVEDLFFFFCFSLFKKTKICFGSTKIENQNFLPGKKIRKNDFAPSEKNFLLHPCSCSIPHSIHLINDLM